ncbi:hypothetical protein N8Z26_07430 [Burkholderiales bacterium]|nr:hypothetical protein [Burkholderiales bacterium]
MRSICQPGRLILFVLLMSGFILQAWAGGSARREQMVANYSGCDWTDAMGQELYQCIKDNNGFSTLYCFNTTIENSCEKKSVSDDDMNSMLAQNDQSQETDSGGTVPIDEEIYEKAMEQEYKMFQFRDCPYTEEMGDYMFECIKENDGFNAHGCFKDSVTVFCPESDK